MDHRRIGTTGVGLGPRIERRNLGLVFALLAALVTVFMVSGGASPAQASSACEPGFYDAGNGCVAADPGYFVELPGATQQTECAAGSYQPFAGQVSCLLAPVGTFVAVTGAVAANECPIGRYQPSAGQTSCLLAPPGSFVDVTGAVAAIPCAPGSYQPSAGQSSCLLAPPGSFVDVTGAVAAIQCAPGKYQPFAGQISCLLAPAGTFVDVTGAVAAIPCAPGSYQPSAGQTSCLLADPGFFVDVTGAVAQIPCPADTTSSGGAVECSAIETGYTFSGFFAPVDLAPTLNVVKAGQAVPLKFHVSDSNGDPVTDLTGVTIKVTSLACSAGATSDLLEEVATGSSGLQNLGDGYYQFNWKTPKSYGSSCKTMSLDLGDGVAHAALFQFRK
jgi:hypothetical protein